jgi:hypothetical protein
MGAAADLFFSNDVARETLHRRITPTDDQFEAQKNRWNDLASFLKSRLKEDTGLSTRTWLQGSYKFDTQIRPWSLKAEFDIDLGLYFEWEGDPEDGDQEPENLKALVQQALIDYQADEENDATGVEDPKERCCRISFNPDFHIDIPCYHLDADQDVRALATESHGWEDSDPKAIYQWFKDRYEDAARRAQMRRQVRYLKMWAALSFDEGKRPSSILLTVLVAEALEGYAIEGVQDDELLEHVIHIVSTRIEGSSEVLNPIDSTEDLNRLEDGDNTIFVDKLLALKDITVRANEARDKAASAEIWAEAFGQFFPMPEDNNEEVKVERARGALVIAFDPQVEVLAVPRNNQHRGWTGLNEIPQIPKGCDITFRLRNADQLPRGATLRWTVRNRGDEAGSLNDLGHSAGDGIEIVEQSSYNGDHAMDLTVYLGSQIIGRRRIAIKIRGMAIPLRNPPRRRYFG